MVIVMASFIACSHGSQDFYATFLKDQVGESATIRGTIGERYPLPPVKDGTKRFNYGKAIGIFMGVVWVYIPLWLLLGPEMTQEEREEQRVEAQEYERDRMSGMGSEEIGARRAEREMGGSGAVEESKGEGAVEYIEDKEKGDV